MTDQLEAAKPLELTLDSLKSFANETVPRRPSFYIEIFQQSTERIQEKYQNNGITQITDLPCIVIPDLHARRDMVISTLEQMIWIDGKEISIFHALQQELINVVSLGDIIHTESITNWKAFDMEQEFLDSIHTQTLVSFLHEFPNFHQIIGNHDDIDGSFLGPTGRIYSIKKGTDPETGAPIIKSFPVDQTTTLINGLEFDLEEDYRGIIDPLLNFQKALPLILHNSYQIFSHSYPEVIKGEFDLPSNELIDAMNTKSKLGYKLVTTGRPEIDSKAYTNAVENAGLPEPQINEYNDPISVEERFILPIVNSRQLDNNFDWIIGHTPCSDGISMMECYYKDVYAYRMIRLNHSTMQLILYQSPTFSQPFILKEMSKSDNDE